MDDKSHIKVPKTSVLMVSPRDYRLSSLTGFCVNFKRGVPILVPPHVFVEAIECGAEVFEPDQESKEPDLSGLDLPDDELVDEPVPEPEPDLPDAESALEQAIRVVLARNDPEDFKTDGSPKQIKIIAEMAPEYPRPTATEISDAYQKLQEDVNLAED